VSLLPVAQRIKREVSQSVETQNEHKLPGERHQRKPRDLATTKSNPEQKCCLQQLIRESIVATVRIDSQDPWLCFS
jgi:hypothetical protein